MFKRGKLSERGQGEVLFVLLIWLVVLIAVLIWIAIQDARAIAKFDSAFESGKVKFTYGEIPLGSQGSPVTENLSENIPDADESIIDHPRLFEVSECESLSLPEDAKGVRAFTPYFAPEQVTITVPQYASGEVNVCVPKGTQIQVVIWSN